MSKVNFKTYEKFGKSDLPTQLEIIVSLYGPYLTFEQFQKCTGYKKTCAYKIVRSGAIKAMKSPGKRGVYRIAAVDVVKYMDKHATGGD